MATPRDYGIMAIALVGVVAAVVIERKLKSPGGEERELGEPCEPERDTCRGTNGYCLAPPGGLATAGYCSQRCSLSPSDCPPGWSCDLVSVNYYKGERGAKTRELTSQNVTRMCVRPH